MRTMAGAIHPSTLKVLAMSEITPRLVGAKLDVATSDVDIVSVVEFLNP